jgi:hypothetical protein
MTLSILDYFERLPYFTIAGVRQLMDPSKNTEQRSRELLSRWAQASQIIMLKRGVYMTRLFYELHHDDADFTPAVSSILVPSSYVSLEYVLQRSGALTELTYPVTAVTTKKTRTIVNKLGIFDYRHVKPPLYLGFRRMIFYDLVFHYASTSKALFDFLYLRPLPRAFRSAGFDMVEELRLNITDFDAESREEFGGYVERSGSEKMRYILAVFRRTAWRH